MPPRTIITTMTDSPTPQDDLKKRNSTIALILVVIVALGAVVAFNYSVVLKRQQEESNQRPAFKHRIQENMDFLDQNGESFSLSRMQGKVYLVCYVFTQCPNQCIGVIESVKEFADKYPDSGNLEFVVVSLEPDVDRPEVLKEWAQLHDVDSERWHFLTTPEVGASKQLHDFMEKSLLFFRVTPIAGPNKYEHDQRVGLIDGAGNLREQFDLLDLEAPEMVRAKLNRQIGQLLNEKPQRGPWLVWIVVLFGVVFLLFGLIFVGGAQKQRAKLAEELKRKE